MTVYEKGLATILVCDALFVALAVPLVLRKVGPNVVYGYRTRATLADEELWYAANEYFGRRFIAWSLVSAAAAFYVARSGLLTPDLFLPASVALLGAPVAAAGILTSRFVRRFTAP